MEFVLLVAIMQNAIQHIINKTEIEEAGGRKFCEFEKGKQHRET